MTRDKKKHFENVLKISIYEVILCYFTPQIFQTKFLGKVTTNLSGKFPCLSFNIEIKEKL